MKKPRQNHHRQEKEKQATAIDRTMNKEANTIDTTIAKTIVTIQIEVHPNFARSA